MTEPVTTVQVGQIVPDFELTTYEPTKNDFGAFSLAKARKEGSWTILFFYPADFTFVWATEFAALAEQQERLAKLGAKLVTVSADTQFVHLAWKREEKELENVKFSMGSDPTGKVARLFGVWLDDAGLALRGTFIINPEGKLMNSEVNFLNMGRNIDELMRRFKANLYLAKKTNEGCPSKWKDEGDKTLVPGPELVGRVHEVLRG